MSPKRLRLDGKVAIVTGGARGIGRGIAEALVEAGASVVLTARTQVDLDRAVSEIEAHGGRAVAVAGDVTNRADNECTIRAALESFGRIDILINNAGGTYESPFFDISVSKFERLLKFNLLSAFELTQLAVPHILKCGGGSVVNISSRSAQFGGTGFMPYSVSKAALEQLTRTMAWELAPKIRVNAIAVGIVQTDAWDSALQRIGEDSRQNFMSKIPLQRVGRVEDIGLAALYLCSDASYATATVMNVDGGLRGAIV